LKSLEDINNVPFFILVGENDTRVNIPDSKALIQRAKSKDKQMEIIDNARHLLFPRYIRNYKGRN
jgi:alpha-beta hydrolase superfamily lysophospholipase